MQPSRGETRLGTAPIPQLLLQMALPSILAQLVNLLYSIVDRIYIGHLPGVGAEALAGVGVCSSIIILVASFAQLASGGSAPLCSIALGQGDREKAEHMLGNSTTLLILFSGILVAVLYPLRQMILLRIGASAATLPYAMSYLSVYLLGTPFVMLTIGLNPFTSCQGAPHIAMISVVTGAILNILLDPLFMFVLELGVRGAAIATVISQAVSSLFPLRFLLSQKTSLRIRRSGMRLSREICTPVLALGLSPFIMSSTESLIGFVLNGSLAVYGDIYVSALTVMQSAMLLISAPLMGFSQGASPVISYNYGHQNVARLKQATKVVMAVMFSFNFILDLAMLCFPSVFARMFTTDPELIEVVSYTTPLFMTGMLIFGLQRACQTMFVALNQPKISLFIALLRKVILLIPLALLLPRWLGVNGVFLAESLADGLAAMTCILLFLYRFPRILAKMETAGNE